MRKLIIIVVCLFGVFFNTPSVAKLPSKVIVTFFWKSEDGGTYDCDGDRLHRGVAAVDFNIIPQNTHLVLCGDGETLNVVTKDCGGRDVISRKASRERGYGRVPVIDVWMPSEAAAERMEGSFRGLVSINDSSEPQPRKEAPVKERPRIAYSRHRHIHFYCDSRELRTEINFGCYSKREPSCPSEDNIIIAQN